MTDTHTHQRKGFPVVFNLTTNVRLIRAVGNERGDTEIKDYVVWTRVENDVLPPRPLILDYTMTS